MERDTHIGHNGFFYLLKYFFKFLQIYTYTVYGRVFFKIRPPKERFL